MRQSTSFGTCINTVDIAGDTYIPVESKPTIAGVRTVLTASKDNHVRVFSA